VTGRLEKSDGHHPVFQHLCPVHGLVRHIQQELGVMDITLGGRHADGHCNGNPVADKVPFHLLPDPLGDFLGPVQGNSRQEDAEFLAPVSEDEVAVPNVGVHYVGQLFQYFIPPDVAHGIVILFKVVHVNHQKAYGQAVLQALLDFLPQGGVKGAPVAEPGEPVLQGLQLKHPEPQGEDPGQHRRGKKHQGAEYYFKGLQVIYFYGQKIKTQDRNDSVKN